jgi:hypothetical protein
MPIAAAAFLAALIGAWGAQLIQPDAALRLPGAPWSWLIATAPVLFGFVAGLLRPRQAAVEALGSGALAIAALSGIAATCWPIAVFPVGVDGPSWLARIGLGDPLSSLPFAVALLAVLLNLAVSSGRRLRLGPSRVRYLVLHGGLIVAIAGGAAGHGGLVRARFVLQEGAPAVRTAITEAGAVVELPMAIALDDFQLERFPPMLLLAGPGEQLRRGEVLLGPGAVERIDGLDVRVEDWLPSAAVAASGERPVAFADPSAHPAAEVTVRDAGGAMLGRGWLHPPGPYGGALFLGLPDGRTLHLEPPRPRRFLAQVRADSAPVEILVNRPLVAGGWAIYLLSYDEAMGAASRSAVFEAVEDRALPAVHLGVALVILGVLLHLWRPLRPEVRP